MSVDTDSDGLVDSIDDDPLVPLGQQVVETELEIARDLVLGAVFGQAGVEGGLCYGIVGGASASVFYVVGWFVFSLVPVADTLTNIRDAAQCIANGDGVGAALYGSGVLLSLVDAGAIATATGAVAIFIKLNPEKTAPLLRVLADVLKYLPDEVIEPTVRLFDKTGSVDRIIAGIRVSGGSWGDVLGLVAKDGSLEDISFIVSKARLADAMMLVGKGVSVSDIVRVLDKGGDLDEAAVLLDKGGSVQNIIDILNRGNTLADAIRLLNKPGIGINDVLYIVNLDRNLNNVIDLVKRGNDLRWLEQGTETWGWIHIEQRMDQFTGVFGQKSEEEIKDMIIDTIKTGDIDESGTVAGDQIEYIKQYVDPSGKLQNFHVIVSDRINGIGKGNVVTSFPEKINY